MGREKGEGRGGGEGGNERKRRSKANSWKKMMPFLGKKEEERNGGDGQNCKNDCGVESHRSGDAKGREDMGKNGLLFFASSLSSPLLSSRRRQKGGCNEQEKCPSVCRRTRGSLKRPPTCGPTNQQLAHCSRLLREREREME